MTHGVQNKHERILRALGTVTPWGPALTPWPALRYRGCEIDDGVGGQALLSKPYRLRPKSLSKSTPESSRDSTLYDREVPESLQNELDGMQLPDTDTVRWRIQTAMPFVFPSVKLSISCQPLNVSVSALRFLQPSILIRGPHPIDPWTILEDGAGSCPSSINTAAIAGCDHANMKALSWLKGASRICKKHQGADARTHIPLVADLVQLLLDANP
ncbi:hypothetical protein Tco_0037675 [Tanacetum coccineum]